MKRFPGVHPHHDGRTGVQHNPQEGRTVHRRDMDRHQNQLHAGPHHHLSSREVHTCRTWLSYSSRGRTQGWQPLRSCHRLRAAFHGCPGFCHVHDGLATFYRVLHERLNDVASGTEASRREERQDDRQKDHLFTVKQLEQPRRWLVTYLKAAMLKPTRKYKLDISKYPKATISQMQVHLAWGQSCWSITRPSEHCWDSRTATNNRAPKASWRPWQSWRPSKTGVKELSTCQVELKERQHGRARSHPAALELHGSLEFPWGRGCRPM